jgi:hypothetical protein
MSETNPNLGKLESVHGISPVFAQRAVIVAALSFVFFLVMLGGFYVRQNIGYFILSTAFLVVYVFTMFGWVMARRNVFSIYENGFTFRKKTFLWNEVEKVERKTENRLKAAAKTSYEIKKSSGETVVITESILGSDKIYERVSKEIEKRSRREQIL